MKIPLLIRPFFLLFIICHTTNVLAYDLVLKVVGGEEGAGQIFASRLESYLRKADPDIGIEAGGGPFVAAGKRLIIAFGSRGWKLASENYPADIPMLAVTPSGPALEAMTKKSGRTTSLLVVEQPATRIVNLASLLVPKGAVITTLLGPSSQQKQGRIEGLVHEAGLRLMLDKAEREAEVGPAIERMLGGPSVFAAIPDPVVHSVTTAQPLLLLTYRAGVPVVAYSESYLRAGAAVAVYTNPDQLAQQVAEIATAYRQGRGLPASQGPKYFSVALNPAVVRSLGLSWPAADELENRLRQMRE